MSVTQPAESSPITPAVTPDSTASMKRRRSSSSAFALMISCALRLEIDRHLFEGRAEPADIVAGKTVFELNVQIALAHLLGGGDQLSDRHHQTVREARPIQIAEVSSVSARSTYIIAKTNCYRPRNCPSWANSMMLY